MIVKNLPVARYNRGRLEYTDDPVITEEWIEVYLNGQHLMGTPVTDREIEELIYGYLFMEGYLEQGERIDIAKKPSGYFVNLDKHVEVQSMKELVDCTYSKLVFKEPIDPLVIEEVYAADFILDLVKDFQKLPSVSHETGGVHMAAFADREGIRYWADDISRRNAFDKVLGKIFLSENSSPRGIVLSSGRVSSDIVVRLIRSGIPIIASVSAPTAKAVELAEAYGITVCGFVRGRRMNVYTHQNRVVFGET